MILIILSWYVCEEYNNWILWENCAPKRLVGFAWIFKNNKNWVKNFALLMVSGFQITWNLVRCIVCLTSGLSSNIVKWNYVNIHSGSNMAEIGKLAMCKECNQRNKDYLKLWLFDNISQWIVKFRTLFVVLKTKGLNSSQKFFSSG